MGSHWPDLSTSWTVLKTFARFLNSHLHYIYLVYAISAVLLSATLTPGFQVPDERAHFLRTERVSAGVFVGRFILQQAGKEHRTSPDKRIIYPDSGGYMGNPGINYAAQVFDSMTFDPGKKITAAQIKTSNSFYWNSELAIVNFPNTGFYPPTGYLLSAVGVLIGKLIHMSILNTLILSRILNGIGCAIICFFALGLANRSRLLLFTILLLPLSVFIFGSVSQDGMLVSLSAVLVGLIDHIESSDKKIYRNSHLIIILYCITAISVARPPYYLFAFVFLFLHLTPKKKLLLIATPFIVIFLWGLVNAGNYAVAFAPPEMRVNAKLQMAYVLGHPFRFIGLFFQFDWLGLADSIRESIGVLGWLDVVLPGTYYKLAILIFLLAAIKIAQFNMEKLKLRAVFVFAAIVSFISIMAAQYITWSPLEISHLGGVQSRYFTPVIFFLFAGIAGFHSEEEPENWQVPIVLLAAAFPLISQVVMVNSLVNRYYLN